MQRVYLGGIEMRNRLWLIVPQAIVLEVTRNLDLALRLTEGDPDLLVITANWLTARPLVIPLEADSDENARLEALRQFHEAKDTLADTSRYQQAQQRVHQRLIAGGDYEGQQDSRRAIPGCRPCGVHKRRAHRS